MYFRRVAPIHWCVLVVYALTSVKAGAEDPKPRPENTISVQLAEPVKPQAFSRPLKFFLVDVIDRSGKAQPMMVFKPRGWTFFYPAPVEKTRTVLATLFVS